MSNIFSTCLLVQEGTARSELVERDVDLKPGISFSTAPGESVLLAGGFTSFFPEVEFPLSPTLQLNLDRASFSKKELAQLAAAELKRINRVKFSSYTVEAE